MAEVPREEAKEADQVVWQAGIASLSPLRLAELVVFAILLILIAATLLTRWLNRETHLSGNSPVPTDFETATKRGPFSKVVALRRYRKSSCFHSSLSASMILASATRLPEGEAMTGFRSISSISG